MAEKVKAVVEIFNEEYTVRGESTPDHMLMLAQYVDKKMKQIASRQPMLSIAKVAVLTALNLADELSRLQQDYDVLISLMDEEKKTPESSIRRFDKAKRNA